MRRPVLPAPSDGVPRKNRPIQVEIVSSGRENPRNSGSELRGGFDRQTRVLVPESADWPVRDQSAAPDEHVKVCVIARPFAPANVNDSDGRNIPPAARSFGSCRQCDETLEIDMLNKPLMIAAIAATLTTATLSERPRPTATPRWARCSAPASVRPSATASITTTAHGWVARSARSPAPASPRIRAATTVRATADTRLWRILVLRRFAGLLPRPPSYYAPPAVVYRPRPVYVAPYAAYRYPYPAYGRYAATTAGMATAMAMRGAMAGWTMGRGRDRRRHRTAAGHRDGSRDKRPRLSSGRSPAFAGTG